MQDNESGEQPENSDKKSNWGGNMLERTQFQPENISLGELVLCLGREQREKLTRGYDLKKFAKIFEDEAMMTTVTSFFANGMNVSETSRRLYMHRNTLIYRLNKIQNLTGLDIRNFDMAVTFEILRKLYFMK